MKHSQSVLRHNRSGCGTLFSKSAWNPARPGPLGAPPEEDRERKAVLSVSPFPRHSSTILLSLQPSWSYLELCSLQKSRMFSQSVSISQSEIDRPTTIIVRNPMISIRSLATQKAILAAVVFSAGVASQVQCYSCPSRDRCGDCTLSTHRSELEAH